MITIDPEFFTATSVPNLSNLLTLNLDVRQPGVNAAPAPVWFECLTVNGSVASGPAAGEVYDPKTHRIIYEWRFGDDDNARPSIADVLNIPEEWKDLNTAQGREAAHVFKTGRAEAYEVTCYAYEPATQRFGSETVQIQIGDADEIFAGDKTIIFNPGGVADASAFPDAVEVTSNWGAVKAARSGAGDKRILIAPGVSLSEQLFRDDRWDNIRIGPLDPLGPKFILNAPDPGAFDFTETLIHDADPDASELVIYGARCLGDWDSATQTGKPLDPFYFRKFTDGSPNNMYSVLFSNCEFDGWRLVSAPTVVGSDVALQVVHECVVTNWQDYGVQGSTTRRSTADLGCSIFQNPDGLSGGFKNALHAAHGCVRDFGGVGQSLIISACDLFSRNGWFPGTSGTDLQPTIRINTNGVRGAKAFVNRVVAEGTIALTEQNANNTDVAVNVVFDMLITIRGAKGMFEVIWNTYGGVTLRNWLAVQLDAPTAARNFGSLVNLDTRSTSAEGRRAPVEIFNVTVVDLRGDALVGGIDFEIISTIDSGNGTFENLTIGNNILHEPFRTGVPNASAPVDIATVLPGVVSRDRGPRYGFLQEGGGSSVLLVNIAPGDSLPEIPYADIKTTLHNAADVDDGVPTDFAYWQANLGLRSGLSIHTGGYGNATTYHAHRGEFEVIRTATGIQIRNTSTRIWQAGLSWSLSLDRTSVLPDFNPAFDTRGATIPLPKATGTSTALTGDPAMPSPRYDLLGVLRNDPQAGAVLG